VPIGYRFGKKCFELLTKFTGRLKADAGCRMLSVRSRMSDTGCWVSEVRSQKPDMEEKTYSLKARS
jgi:hypothetical protein